MNAPPEHAADPLVDLVVEEPEWERALPDLHAIATSAAEMALDVTGLPDDRFAVAVLACNDETIAALNGQFRGKAEPTNVLAWPAFELAAAAPGRKPARPSSAGRAGRTQLGDVAIALETVTREAEIGGAPLKNHVLHLILHGCLHLLGHDHGTREDAELMEGLERLALARVGVPDPYA